MVAAYDNNSNWISQKTCCNKLPRKFSRWLGTLKGSIYREFPSESELVTQIEKSPLPVATQKIEYTSKKAGERQVILRTWS